MSRSGPKQKKPVRSTGPTLFPIEDDPPVDGVSEVTTPTVQRWGIPASWAWATFGEIGEVRLGMARSPKNRPGTNAVKYLRAANITVAGLDLSNLLEMDFDAEAREVYALRVGDIVLSEASGSPDHVGKPAVWRGELPVCCIQNTVVRVRPLGVSSDYAFVVCQHYFQNGLFASLVRGVGIGHLGVDRFSQLPFPIPPRGEQDRIAAEYFVQAERAAKALAALRSAEEKMRLQGQAIARQELGLDASEPSADDTTLAKWTPVRLGDICDAVNGRAFKSSEWREKGVPIIRIQNLRNEGTFNYFDGELDDKHRVKSGDLLFAWSGDSGTSFGAHVWQGAEGALNQHIYRITPDERRVSRDFLLRSINAKLGEFAAAAKGGGKRLHLTRDQFLDAKVSLPPLNEQRKIVAAIEAHEVSLAKQSEVVTQNISRTESLLKSLLARAVDGALVGQASKEGTAATVLAECKEKLDSYIKDLGQRRLAARGNSVGKKKTTTGAQPKKDLVEVLKEEGPLLPKELLRKAGYREENTGDIEEFYRLLHAAHRNKKIAEATNEGPRDEIKLKAVV